MAEFRRSKQSSFVLLVCFLEADDLYGRAMEDLCVILTDLFIFYYMFLHGSYEFPRIPITYYDILWNRELPQLVTTFLSVIFITTASV
jgi:hypothetical protein